MITSQAFGSSNASRMRCTTLVILGGILCGALWLRVAQLNQPSLHTDEYLHVLAAQKLANGEEPRLPSSNLYERAMPYTRIVASSFALFGISETSARLPSVVFGTLAVLVTYLLGRRWLGVWPALVAAALVAISPIMVDPSRLCRMYSLFHLLYLGILFAYERGWEGSDTRFVHRVLWCAIALLLFLASVHIHPLTLVGLVPALVVYWVGRSVLQWRSRYTLCLLVAAAIGASAITVGALNLTEVWQGFRYAPSWAEGHRFHETFYLKKWASSFPWIWWVAPVAALFLLVRYRARGFLVACLFMVPFGLHSLIFAWKHVRYVSHLFPMLALMVAPLLVWGVHALTEWARVFVVPWCRTLPQWYRPIVTTVCVVVVMFLVIGAFRASLTQALALQDGPHRPRWREAYGFLAHAAKSSDAIVASIPLAASYYLGRSATQVVDNYRLDFRKKMTKNSDGMWIDWYSGLPMVTSLEEFQNVQAVYARGWLLVDRGRFRTPEAVPKPLRRHILTSCQEYPVVTDGSVRIFLWDRTTDQPSSFALAQ